MGRAIMWCGGACVTNCGGWPGGGVVYETCGGAPGAPHGLGTARELGG